MSASQLRILACANVSDVSWRGDLPTHWQLERAHFLTDLFVGTVSYFESVSRTLFESGSHRVPLLGHLVELGTALLGSGDTTIGTYVNEWRLGLSIGSPMTEVVFPDSRPIYCETHALRNEVGQVLDDCLQLALAGFGARPLPAFFAEVGDLASGLARPL